MGGSKRSGAQKKRAQRHDVRGVDVHRVKDVPFQRGKRTVAAQSNADLLQLDMVDMAPVRGGEAEAEAEASRAARERLTRLTERDNSLKSYMKELRKVLEHADVILEVLDVRDPLGCRAYAVEEEAHKLGKRVVLILNKIDLVPRANAKAWLEYLRKDFPTLPFKASTQQQRRNLAQGEYQPGGDAEAWTGGAEAVGTRAILQLIKNYSRNLNLKSSITVGTIGVPNVGKSSLINSLKRSRVCGVASTPGHTKVVQGVMLDRHIRLLDSPGIVFSDANAPPGASAAEIAAAAESAMLRNVLKVELVEDPHEPVHAILQRIDPSHLAAVYGIPPITSRDVQEFLLRVAYQKGRLARGGVPDLDGTARSVLHDWNTGKIKYHTEPPARHPDLLPRSKGTDDGDAAVRTEFSAAFDLGDVLGDADADVFGDGAYSPPAEPQLQPPSEPPSEPQPPADTSATDSALGKRALADSSDESEAEEPTWAASEDDEDAEPVEPVAPVVRPAKPMFAPNEAEGMAPARGKERRKARKQKKRKAGLVNELDTWMDLGPEAEEAPKPAEPDAGAESAASEEL